MAWSREWGQGIGRLHINVSQMEAFANCERKWAFQYLDGESDRGNSFAQFGIIVHLLLEKWFAEGVHPATSWPEPDHAEVAESGLHHWPAPGTTNMAVEAQFTLRVDTPDGPIFLKGTRDLVWETPGFVPFADLTKEEQVAQLFVPGHQHCQVVLGDHKTTTDFRWAKTEAELRENIQAMVYALATMEQFDVEEVECRWVYLRTRGARKSHKVSIVVTKAEAREVVIRKCVPLIQGIFRASARAKVPTDLKPNIHHCSDYGGCPFRDQCGIRAIDRLKGKMAHMDLKAKMLARIKKNADGPAPDGDVVAPTDPINPPEAKKAKAPAATPKAIIPSKEALKRPDPEPTIIEDDEPSVGDEVHVTDAPVVDADRPGFVLLIGCLPAGVKSTLAADIVAEAHQKVRDATRCEDYRLIEFGKGTGFLAAEVRELLQAPETEDYVYLDPTSPEEQATMAVFIEAASVVIRRV